MAERTGTASQIDGSGGNGSTSVTVPADATGVVAFGAHWDENGNSTLALTLNGVSIASQAQLAEGATTNESGVAALFLANPATGSQTLAWTWSAGGARAEGGEIVLVYVKDIHASTPVRAAGVNATTFANNLEVTISSAATDLVLAFATSLNEEGGAPAISGTVFINNADVNLHDYDVSQVTAGVSTTTVTMTGEVFSTMAAISLQTAEVGGGGLGIPLAMHHYRQMHGA